MDSRVLGALLLFAFLCLGAVGGVAAEAGAGGTGYIAEQSVEQPAANDPVDVTNRTDERPAPARPEMEPTDEPGVYRLDTSDLSVVLIEVLGPGGGGGAEDAGDDGGAESGGDGGYVEAEVDVSEFVQLEMVTGFGGVGGDGDTGGTGGDGFYAGGQGGYQSTLDLTNWHSSGGGGGGASVVRGVFDNGTEVPLLAAGGGGGGGAWDQFLGPSDNTGGGGGAPGGLGGTAEGGTLGGGDNGNDAGQSSGPIENIGGDGGDSTPNSASAGEDGGSWVHDQYVIGDPTTIAGGGAAGGDGISDASGGEPGEDGAVTVRPRIVVDSLDYPDPVATDENLTVEYTLRNDGNVNGTVSFVDLKVEGTDATYDDTDADVTVPGGETVNGTLTFEAVDQYFDPEDTISFSVELWNFPDNATGQATVEEAAAPNLVVDSLAAPNVIEPSENLEVDYTVENTGDAPGTESAVELSVDGTVEDSDSDISLGPGETANGTLVFDAVEENYGAGDKIPFTVSLADFGDSQSGETNVEDLGGGPALVISDIDAPGAISVAGSLEVGYTLQNAGGSEGTESTVALSVGGDTVDSDSDVTVGAGQTETGTLVFENVDANYQPGETVSFTVSLADFGDSTDRTTFVLEPGQIQLSVETSTPVVEPGTNQTYELVVTDPDGGILGYQGLTVDIKDPTVAEIVDFEQQYGSGIDVDSSEIRNGGGQLYLSAATGDSFQGGAAEQVVATFDVEATGADGDSTGISFNNSAPQTVAEFQNASGSAYAVNGYEDSTLLVSSGDSGGGPDLTVSSASAPASVEPGSEVPVEYTVANTGGALGSDTVELLVDGLGTVGGSNVTLGVGETTDGTLTVGTDAFEAGDTISWTVRLAEFDGNESGETDVEEQGESVFTLQSVTTNAPVVEGETLEVTADIENNGSVAGTKSVEVSGVDGSSETVQLDPGDSTSETFTLDTEVGDAGEYTVTVSTPDDSVDTSATIREQPPELPGGEGSPSDMGGDGKYEDVNGDDTFDILDVQMLFDYLDTSGVTDYAWAYDYDDDGQVTIFDVQILFDDLTS